MDPISTTLCPRARVTQAAGARPGVAEPMSRFSLLGAGFTDPEISPTDRQECRDRPTGEISGLAALFDDCPRTLPAQSGAEAPHSKRFACSSATGVAKSRWEKSASAPLIIIVIVIAISPQTPFTATGSQEKGLRLRLRRRHFECLSRLHSCHHQPRSRRTRRDVSSQSISWRPSRSRSATQSRQAGSLD